MGVSRAGVAATWRALSLAHHPDSSSAFAKFVDDLVAGDGEAEPTTADILQGRSGVMEVLERLGLAQRVLRRQVEALNPQAAVSIPLGSEVEGVAARRPGHRAILAFARSNRDPFPGCLFPAGLEGRHKNARTR